jgi:uncharacterized membrane protein
MRGSYGKRTDGQTPFVGVVRRAFAEFLALPTTIVGGFILLAAMTYMLDRFGPSWLEPFRANLQRWLFSNAKTTSDLLSTIASGLLTVTSITISLLLLALQQAASALTHQIFDQFLRRRVNQIFFGYFVGLTLFTLLTLATVDDPFNPVVGATLALAMTVVALLLLLVLLYSSINQMRPAEIIGTIHDLTIAARERQLPMVRKTRRSPRSAGDARAAVACDRHGSLRTSTWTDWARRRGATTAWRSC